MIKNQFIKPTEAELEILNVLWELGPCTVREVHERISEHKDAGYTTILKQMQIMLEKGQLKRDASNRTHIFTPNITQEETQRTLLGRLMDTAFGGSAMKLVMQALGNNASSPEELGQIRKLLDDLESPKSE